MLALKTLARLVNDAGDVLVRVEDAVFELTGALRVDLRSGGAVELLVVGSEVCIPVPRGHEPHGRCASDSKTPGSRGLQPPQRCATRWSRR